MGESSGHLNPRSLRAWESFRAQVVELGGVVLEPEWLGALKAHRCWCARGHECGPRPNDVQQGVGITSHGGSARLSGHRRNGFTEVIQLETGLPEGLAIHIEQKIKATLAMAGAKPVQGEEYFSEESIALILNEISIWV